MRLLILFACISTAAFGQKYEGMALTPPMGWNTWNSFQRNISEAVVEQTADAMIASGMRDAGYVYVVLDDTWSAKERDPNGDLVGDPMKFPHGMKALGDYLHARGFKFGIYTCAGSLTCAGYPGARGHEFQDARRYASWGVDYLKEDWCYTGTANGPETYRIMRDALRAAGRPIVLSLCEWGQSRPWLWAAPVAELWRTTEDIDPSYRRMKQILDLQVGLEGYAGPGHWNDPDMLEVGNGSLTLAESRAHFSLWCMLAAPLIAGNDVRAMTPEVRDILTNPEVIALDQDPLGHEGFRFRVDSENHLEIWAKGLSRGEWAVCVLNTGEVPVTTTIDWQQITFLSGQYYHLRDLWARKAVGRTPALYTATIASHDVALLRLKPGF
jgi:alpha-galactosidase